MSLVLHQFPISHFCEKVRWALDYKGLDYRLKNHLPGLHLQKIRRFAPASSVPLLEHGGQYVQGSAAIISYLDQQFPARPLTPQEETLASEALGWEAFCDEKLGPHVRRFCYHTLLDHPDVVIPFLAEGGPFWGKPFLTLMFPKLQGLMRKGMKIREPEVSESRAILEQAITVLAKEYQHRDYLVGDAFSRADLAAASLLAPLFMPQGYGLTWPATVPEPLQGWADTQQPQLAVFAALYDKHRGA